MIAIATMMWVCAVAIFSAGLVLDMRRVAPAVSEALYYVGISLAGVAVIALSVEVITSG